MWRPTARSVVVKMHIIIYDLILVEILDRHHIALPSSFDFVETKGTVLGWRWVLLDRWVRIQPVTAFIISTRGSLNVCFIFIYF